jgi:hypothetical protein
MERNTVTQRIGNFRKQEMRDEEKRSEQCRRRAGPRGHRGGTTPGLSFEGVTPGNGVEKIRATMIGLGRMREQDVGVYVV